LISVSRLYGTVNARWVGVGGWKCNCCGPRPKDRARWRRRLRRRLKQQDRIG